MGDPGDRPDDAGPGPGTDKPEADRGRSRGLALLGALALGCAAVHLGRRLAAGEVRHLLWLSNLATVTLAAGCLARRRELVGIALLWLAFDALLWTAGVAGGGAIDSAVLTHVVSFAIAVVAVRLIGPPGAGTWLVAAAVLAALVAAARLFTPAADNIDFAFATPSGGHERHLLTLGLLFALAAAVFAGVERLARTVDPAAALLDHLLVPALFAATVVATQLLLADGAPPFAISVGVVFVLAGAVAILERVRPERADHRPLDQPFATELAHFLFNYNLGYALALGACALVAAGAGRLGLASPWPTSWPLPAQVAVAVVLAEAASYWQHRLFHQVAWLWPFHALHHSGERLNLVRAARFHAVDIGPGSFLVFAPIVILRAPPVVVTWTAVLAGALGIFQHANLRTRTPAVVDRLLCTPAVHRFHHSRDRREADANYGTTIMLFDRLFGTYRAPPAPGPRAVGIAGERRPRGFVAQSLAPFRGQRGSVQVVRLRRPPP